MLRQTNRDRDRERERMCTYINMSRNTPTHMEIRLPYVFTDQYLFVCIRMSVGPDIETRVNMNMHAALGGH